MAVNRRKANKKHRGIFRRRFLFPLIFMVAALILMILPLGGFVTSVRTLLAYIFIPQVRLSHSTAKYVNTVYQTVSELVDAHAENRQLKQQLEMNHMLAEQAQSVMQENKRLSALLNLTPQRRWQGVWAKVAYHEPTQWNTVIIDKGSADGIVPRSAVLSLTDEDEGLAGVVVETTENTSKVLLVRDEDFAAAVVLSGGQEEGLLTGAGARPARIKYIPLGAEVKKGDAVYTAAASSIFPAGILVGKVINESAEENFQTARTVEIEPAVRSGAVKEVFVILDKEKAER